MLAIRCCDQLAGFRYEFQAGNSGERDEWIEALQAVSPHPPPVRLLYPVPPPSLKAVSAPPHHPLFTPHQPQITGLITAFPSLITVDITAFTVSIHPSFDRGRPSVGAWCLVVWARHCRVVDHTDTCCRPVLR